MKKSKIIARLCDRFYWWEQLYVCTKNLYMDNGELAFKKGKIYSIDDKGNATCSEVTKKWYQEEKTHYFERGSNSWLKYFIKLKA